MVKINNQKYERTIQTLYEDIDNISKNKQEGKYSSPDIDMLTQDSKYIKMKMDIVKTIDSSLLNRENIVNEVYSEIYASIEKYKDTLSAEKKEQIEELLLYMSRG